MPPELKRPLVLNVSNAIPWRAETNPLPKAAIQPNRLAAGDTNYFRHPNLDPEILKANSIASNDTMGVWLLGEIEDTKRDLQNEGLNPTGRKLMQDNLAALQARLDDHRSQVQSRAALIAGERINPRSAMTNFSNVPDSVVQSMSALRSRYEHTLSGTNLAPVVRKAYEQLVANIDQHLADHETNVQLWANLHQAQFLKDPVKKAQAEQALASYLGARLGRIQGKTYPANMSLRDVMKEYDKQDGAKFDRRKIIIAMLLVTTCLPLVILGFYEVLNKKRYAKSSL